MPRFLFDHNNILAVYSLLPLTIKHATDYLMIATPHWTTLTPCPLFSARCAVKYVGKFP